MLCPTQTGVLLPTVGTGKIFTTTAVVAVWVHPDAFVNVTVYVPAIPVVAPAILGFCAADVKLFGPDQL